MSYGLNFDTGHYHMANHGFKGLLADCSLCIFADDFACVNAPWETCFKVNKIIGSIPIKQKLLAFPFPANSSILNFVFAKLMMNILWSKFWYRALS